MIDHRRGDALARLLNPGEKPLTPEDLFKELAAIDRKHPPQRRLSTPTPLSTSKSGRLLRILTTAPRTSTPSEKAIQRWRLATAINAFLPGATMMLYGDETLSTGPMRWLGSAAPTGDPADYGQDFTALVQWLNSQRKVHEPLNVGEFRTVLVDRKHKVFAFARSLPGDEVILVVNYGDSRQQATLQAGRQGQMIGVLNPQFGFFARQAPSKKEPGSTDRTPIRRLRIGGSRQVIGSDGNIRIWLEPMSIRVVLINDKEPR